ncbi:ATP synthase E chain family protein [Trichuris trichiura]|uniref:ATP synthase F(0) complex subunit e, mitochondrial n=1 Tax=Trichuris trichiura TaxID=36087 RepID=A0A077Z715_TRITR|nr:ATP synthase E chain family protein [Trichuris trichiura]
MPIVPEHPNRVILKPPINVSPTIRAARYIFLTLGVAYGAYRQKRLEVVHEKFVRKVGEDHLMDRLEKAKKAAISGKESLAEVGKELGFGRTVEWAGYKYEPIDLKKSL